MNRFLDRISYKFRRICIPNLMLYIVIAMAGVFVVELFVPTMPLSLYLYFDRELIFAGQWWRVITWIFIPTSTGIIWIIFSLYFYYLIGSGLEQRWGSFKFNLYYLVGMIATIIGGFIIGVTDNTFLNLSLFFAFAVLYPDFQVMLFFFIPIKVKWLALADLALFIYSFIISGWAGRAAIIASLLNFILFFYEDFGKFIKNQIYYFKHRNKYKNNWRK